MKSPCTATREKRLLSTTRENLQPRRSGTAKTKLVKNNLKNREEETTTKDIHKTLLYKTLVLITSSIGIFHAATKKLC